VRWGLAVVAPLAVSYTFYVLHLWMLTVTGPYPTGYVGSYVSWAFLGLAEWGITGVIASVIAMTAIAGRRSSRKEPSSGATHARGAVEQQQPRARATRSR